MNLPLVAAADALKGKRVAVVVESQYVPREIRIYQQRFGVYGAEVDLVSRLWGQEKASFYSTVEPGVVDTIEYLEVSLDFKDVDLSKYAAVLVAANYTSVRLRWSECEDVTPENAAFIASDVPAARFLQRAMADTRIIKGLPCHALWLLTPTPHLLRGRRVTCNKVVLADVLNTGALYTAPPAGAPREKQVVVDRDLVTNTGWHASEELVDQMVKLILAV